MTNTKNTPIEALERAFPMRVLRYRLRDASGGAGRYRGGDGIERDLEMLEDVTVSVITERRESQPWGWPAVGQVQWERTGCCQVVMSHAPCGYWINALFNFKPAMCCGCLRQAAVVGERRTNRGAA